MIFYLYAKDWQCIKNTSKSLWAILTLIYVAWKNQLIIINETDHRKKCT